MDRDEDIGGSTEAAGGGNGRGRGRDASGVDGVSAAFDWQWDFGARRGMTRPLEGVVVLDLSRGGGGADVHDAAG